jgi:hypothetical protein
VGASTPHSPMGLHGLLERFTLYIYMLRLDIMNVFSVVKIRLGDFKQKQKKSETVSKWNVSNGRNDVGSCTFRFVFNLF